MTFFWHLFVTWYFNLFQVENFNKNISLKTHFLIWLIKKKGNKYQPITDKYVTKECQLFLWRAKRSRLLLTNSKNKVCSLNQIFYVRSNVVCHHFYWGPKWPGVVSWKSITVMPELGGPGGPLAPPMFCRSVNPILTWEGKLSQPITTGPSNVFHLPASLNLYDWIIDIVLGGFI